MLLTLWIITALFNLTCLYVRLKNEPHINWGMTTLMCFGIVVLAPYITFLIALTYLGERK